MTLAIARRCVLVLSLVPGLLAAQALAAGDVNLFYGQKQLSDDKLGDAGVDEQSQFGIQLSLDFDWPVALAVDILSSSEDNTINVPVAYVLQYQTDVSTLELDLGVRKFWREGIRPYVGGGFGWMQLDAKQTAFRSLVPGEGITDVILDDSDSGFGYWLDTGFLYTVGRNFNIGVDLRYSNATATVQPNDTDDSLELDSGGMHFGILLGYRW